MSFGGKINPKSLQGGMAGTNANWITKSGLQRTPNNILQTSEPACSIAMGNNITSSTNSGRNFIYWSGSDHQLLNKTVPLSMTNSTDCVILATSAASTLNWAWSSSNQSGFIVIGGAQGVGSASNPGYRSVAIGYSAYATSNSAIAIGVSSASTSSSAIAIGASASASSTSAIAIGASAVAQGTNISIGGSNVSSGYGSVCLVAGGATNLNGSAYAVSLIGSASQSVTFNSTDHHAISLGANAKPDGVGHFCFTNGVFNSTVGTALGGFYLLRVETTTASVTELGMSLDGTNAAINSSTPTGRITLTNDSSYIFDCDIVARNTATDTETAAFNLKFCIRRGTNAASTTIVGTATKTIIAQDTGTTGWDVSVTADTTNGRPNISVTGEAAKTIRWVCHVRMTKVSG